MRFFLPTGLLRRSRIQIVVTILLLTLNGGVYLLAVAPARREQAKLTIATNSFVSVEKAGQKGDADQLYHQFTSNSQDLETFSSLLLPREDFDHFLGELFEFSEKSRLLLDRINFQPKAHDAHQILEYQVRFNVNGSYEQIRKFVHLLESSPRLIAIRTLSLTGEPSSEGHISVGMKIDTYFRMEAT